MPPCFSIEPKATGQKTPTDFLWKYSGFFSFISVVSGLVLHLLKKQNLQLLSTILYFMYKHIKNILHKECKCQWCLTLWPCRPDGRCQVCPQVISGLWAWSNAQVRHSGALSYHADGSRGQPGPDPATQNGGVMAQLQLTHRGRSCGLVPSGGEGVLAQSQSSHSGEGTWSAPV